ncbi:MAG TPA: tRNA pseudouridine(13) synthase TruD [Steroidobacteraceae bacterium]|nr:tRNA pseudouridine(13) synthase TruD [Steroidobacteraceae bacterium]
MSQRGIPGRTAVAGESVGACLPVVPAAHGEPPLRAVLRARPEDFQVEELLGFDADGEGDHVLLRVEKRGANTRWVAGQLAAAAGVAVREVGYSGLKDRHAATVQHFTVPAARGAPIADWLDRGGEGYRVLGASRHRRKLRPGSHRANRFRILLRDPRGDFESFEARLVQVARLGVPNYFGPQRFGRNCANLERARRWAESRGAPRRRGERAFALTAARSWLFNRLLAERVWRGDWSVILAGEAVVLEGSRSFFQASSDDPMLQARCERMDLHPSGPLWGRGELQSADEARALELHVLEDEQPLRRLLESEGLEQERRSLRLPVMGLGCTAEGEGLRLDFELTRGAFATAVLHEFVLGAWDADGSG